MGGQTLAATAGASRFGTWAIVKNVFTLALVFAVWTAIDTGYFAPDRPTREQWEALELARKAPHWAKVYQSNFAAEVPGESTNTAGTWGRYNGATVSSVMFEPGGVSINYGGTPWIGAIFDFAKFEAGKIYRVTLDRNVVNEPAALLIRNRQMDIDRREIPVGSGPFTAEFVAPRGSRDRVNIIVIPDGRSNPVGSTKITSMKIERLGN